MKGTSRGGPLSMLADSADRVCRVQLLTAPGGICRKEETARSCLGEGSVVDVSFSPYFGGAGPTSLDLPVNGGPAGWTLFHVLAPAFHTTAEPLPRNPDKLLDSNAYLSYAQQHKVHYVHVRATPLPRLCPRLQLPYAASPLLIALHRHP